MSAVLFGLFILINGLAYAQSPAASPCDPDYYKSLKAKAWMEAQREITQNQNLIFKPDSVLEYTCFEKQLGVLAKNAATMFSENPKWGGAAGGMATALTGLVASPMATYLLGNFQVAPNGSAYGLLGGRVNKNDPPITDADGNQVQAGNVGAIASGGGDYNCDIMNRIWHSAKCMGFAADGSHDGFYTLEHYANNDDKRFLPTQCVKPLTTTGGDKWQANYADAITTPPWTKDPVNSYISELVYDGNPNSCSGITPVPTGIEIFIQGGLTRPEKICVMPGCYYNSELDTCAGVIN